MILHMDFEEVQALSSGVELVLAALHSETGSAVIAPPEALADAESLRPRLTGDLSIDTLAEQRRIRRAVALVCDHLRERLESKVIEYSPGHEDAVHLYFDYAHVLTVLDRLDRMGAEMSAMIEVMTGRPVTDAAAATITFPN